jgi:two-component system, OmpR family, sensor histidine kinase KdpD
MASKDSCRPDPDELLRQIQVQETSEKRGRLKIFLGYAPRVGKSVRMFDEGTRRLRRGQDVVVGAIQLKGAEHLNPMLREVEVIPPLIVAGLESIDIKAILHRKPQVCLIDELARENPPGARNKHRWQDVEEILAAGITVVGAVNLQHVCEEQAAVERITGRRAANSVPAGFIHSADELVIVDVPAEEVERSDLTAAQLNELRELALLLAAQVVEEQLQRYMEAHGIKQSWSTQERILVCITPRSSARAMLESAARATQRFHGQMLAVYVKQGELERAAEETLQENLDYAGKLGAEVHVLEGSDAIARILQFAHDERITQLYIGHTQHKPWAFWAQNPVDRLIKAAEGIDVRLFPQTQAA